MLVRDEKGNTFLHNAVEERSLELTNYFLIKGIDLNSANLDGDTPLHLAIRKGYIDVRFFYYY